ncbi:MAG: ribonuclease HII [Alphaproteobacteria bacterium CG11_big_fil_rev_8_21_14_0_20_39_49]|nr:MAG: ribonuclease HII [Alphaproteobacteria bacterium CG11_big_fil_rev_8_21_14_0_20_39_49]
MPDFSIEDGFRGVIAGVDEAGRGPWAGPVVAGAVILNRDDFPSGIDDSKKISEKNREYIFDKLQEVAQIGVGIVNVEDIDEMNILQASMLAMKKAVDNLSVKPDIALIDGNKCPVLDCKAHAVIKGDSKSLSIAAGAIIAKVTRDRIMKRIAEEFPYYGWEKNAGYGTKIHREGLEKYGVTVHHRKSFKPIAQLLAA